VYLVQQKVSSEMVYVVVGVKGSRQQMSSFPLHQRARPVSQLSYVRLLIWYGAKTTRMLSCIHGSDLHGSGTVVEAQSPAYQSHLGCCRKPSSLMPKVLLHSRAAERTSAGGVKDGILEKKVSPRQQLWVPL
jgi:hypothetical protein